MAKEIHYITKREALAKAESYCAYQERSQYEVRGKLIEWGCYGDEAEDILVSLIETNFLNEERFAIAYAGGKFRLKQWGRIKIKQGLKLKQVSDYCVKKALAQIDEQEYLATLQQVLHKKKKELKEKDTFKLKYKLVNYAISKGFEPDLVWQIFKNDSVEE